MFKNNKWMKRVAMAMVIVMTLMTLASCQSGSTKVDEAGDASSIYVTEKDQEPVVPYTGETQVIWTEVADPNAADEVFPHGQRPDGTGSSNAAPDDDSTSSGGDDTAPGTDDSNGTDDSTTPGTDDDNTPGADDSTTPGTDDDGDDGEEVTYDEGNLLRVVSYNLRVGNDGAGANGSSNDIKDRAPRLKKVMNDLDPDIMGFQEVNPTWYDNYLTAYFSSNYDHVIKYRAENNKEATPIFWKKDKFELQDSGYFWLSETPEVESKGFGASHYRICNWVKLKIKATGKVFLYYNTHFDFDDPAHVGSANLIIRSAQSMGGFGTVPVYFTADCNMQRYGEGYNQMLTAFGDINLDLEDLDYKTGGGYHLDGHEGLVKGSPIDYCFYSAELIHPLKYQIIDELVDGGYVSDHKGLYVEMAIK